MKLLSRILLVVLAMFPPLAIPREAGSDLAERLRNGEILLLEADSQKAGGSARVQALISASAVRVWEVIVSCDRSFIFVDGLRTCEVLEDNGDIALVHQVVKKGWLYPTQDFLFESRREPYRRIQFQLVKGSLKSLDGSWEFLETPDGLLVDYRINVRPRWPVPGFIVSHVMRKGMPDLIACIRGLAGGSGSPDERRADLGRCRGREAKSMSLP